MATAAITHKRPLGEVTIVAALSFATSISLVFMVLLRCRVGIDLTDEGLYLNWISRPWLYRQSVTQFGFVYSPLFDFLGHDLVLLRRVNILLTLGLAFVLFLHLLRECAFEAAHRAAFALSLASSALLVLVMWLPTPSYNWLALQGMLISLMGLHLLFKSETLHRLCFAGGAVGLGGLIVALAKPTSAIALAILLTAIGLWEGHRSPRKVLIAAGIAAVVALAGGLIAAWSIDGSVVAFVERLQQGAKLGYTLNPEFEVLRWDPFKPSRSVVLHLALLAIISGTFSYWAASGATLSRNFRIVGLLILALPALASIIIPEHASFKSDRYHAYLVAASSFGALAGAAIRFGSRVRSALVSPIFVTLFLSPFCYAIGTTNNIWLQSAQAFLFWVGAAVVAAGASLHGQHRDLVVAGLSLFAAAITTFLVSDSMERPYRQVAALRTQENPLVVDARATRSVDVDPATAAFVSALRSAAISGQMRRLLDLSGRHPASAYLAGADATGAPWLLGGYRNSIDFFHAVMRSVPCEEIAEAWVLAAPDAEQSLPVSVLTRYGINLERDFRQVTQLSSPWYKTHLELWKPSRPVEEAVQACRNSQ